MGCGIEWGEGRGLWLSSLLACSLLVSSDSIKFFCSSSFFSSVLSSADCVVVDVGTVYPKFCFGGMLQSSSRFRYCGLPPSHLRAAAVARPAW